jgi:hypothetical protein
MSPEPVVTTSSNLDVVTIERAAQNLATTRCARELSCGNIGKDALDECAEGARPAMRQSIASRCPSGVAPGFFSTCLETVRNEACGTAEGMADRLASSCLGVKLCL